MRLSQSLCCPVGGRPASSRKSQTKSQRRPTSGDTQRRQATVKAGQVPTERHQATSSHARNVTGGQGVAGSNPAVPTGSYAFSNIVTPHKSQHKSQLVVQRPLCNGPLEARADRMPRPPYRACANTAEPIEAHSRGAKDHRVAPICTAAPTANRPAPSAPAGGTAPARRGQTKVLKLGPPTPP